MDHPIPINFGMLMIFSLVGLITAAVRVAQRIEPRATIKDIITAASGGAVTSFAVGSFCLYQWGTTQPYLSIIASLLAGWIGTPLIDSLSNFGRQVIVKKLDAITTTTQTNQTTTETKQTTIPSIFFPEKQQPPFPPVVPAPITEGGAGQQTNLEQRP